jgi:hypothetical protein
MAYGVKKEIPKMEMVHHYDVMVELSTHLLPAQCKIEMLHIQLQNVDATIRGYMRMVPLPFSPAPIPPLELPSQLQPAPSRLEIGAGETLVGASTYES